VRLEGLGQLKNPIISSGSEPANKSDCAGEGQQQITALFSALDYIV
jgi:hypothetical protein